MVAMTGLITEGLSRPALCQSCTFTSPIAPGLAGDRHDDELATIEVVGRARDDDGGSALGARLIGEGERNEDDVAEAKADRRRHRRGYPRPCRKRALRLGLRCG